jgi:hypothetical protein
LRAVKFAVETGPLADHAKVYRDIIELDNHSIIQAIPADWKGAAGGNYSCVIFDELHAWVYEWQRRLFDELVIPPTQPGGVRWIASYAGWEGESLLLKELWDRALLGERLPGDLPIYQNKAASMLAFIDTGPDSWRMPWMTPEYISETQQSERPNTFRRIWLNEWTTNESQFLPEGTWQACAAPDVKPIQPGDNRRLILGADASTTRDLTALVGVEYNPGLNTVDVALCRVWKPQRGILRMGKPTVDLAETIGAEVKRLHEAGQIEAIVCDPYQLHSLIIEWEKAGIKVIELAQSSGRVEADQSLYDAVIGRAIRHYNDPTLNEHIKNAIAIETPRGYRLAKEKTSQKIDAAVALSMAHYGALNGQKAIGQTEYVKDPFGDTWPPDPGDQFSSFFGWGNSFHKHHSPGATSWKDCKYRQKGCEECVKESLAEPEEKARQELIARAQRGEIILSFGNGYEPPFIPPPDPRQEAARQVVLKAFRQIRKQAKGE